MVKHQLDLSDVHDIDDSEFTVDIPVPYEKAGYSPPLNAQGKEINRSLRWLYVSGAPGSGKTEVLIHLACTWAKKIRVLIVCPTGQNVYNFKSRIPEDLQENIRVDTLHGVLGYKRTKDDNRVWAPSSLSMAVLVVVFVHELYLF